MLCIHAVYGRTNISSSFSTPVLKSQPPGEFQEPGTDVSCLSVRDQAPFPINQPWKTNNNMRAFWQNQGTRSAFYKHSSERYEGLIRTKKKRKKKKKKENNLFTLPVDCWHIHTGHIFHIVFTWVLSYMESNCTFTQFLQVFTIIDLTECE